VVSEGIALLSPILVLALYCYAIRIVHTTHYNNPSRADSEEGQSTFIHMCLYRPFAKSEVYHSSDTHGNFPTNQLHSHYLKHHQTFCMHGHVQILEALRNP